MRLALAALLLAAGASFAETAEEAGVAMRIAELRSEDAGRRRTAVAALARIGDAAVPALAGMLGEPDWQVRREAARALAAIASEAAQPALSGAARDVNWTVREAAVPGLGRGEALDAAAADTVWRVRAAACQAAARRDPGSVRRLVRDPVPDVRRAAARAIAATGDPEYREEMREMLADPETAEIGLELFAKVGRPADAAAITPLFDAPEPLLAARALRAASDAGLDVAAPAARYVDRTCELRDAAGTPNQDRFAAMLAGLEIMGPPAWAAVAARLEKGDPAMEPEFAVILSRAADPRTVPALKRLLGSRDADVRYLALHALDRTDPAQATDAAIGLLADTAPSVRIEAATVLTRTAEGREALAESWEKLDPAARRVAIGALARDRALESRGLMTRALRSGDAWERAAAHEWFLGRRDAAYLKDLEDHFSREQSAENRCRILATVENDAPLHPGLVRLACDDGAVEVRLLAVRLLGRLRDPSPGPALRRALGDANARVRAKALEVIAATEGFADIDSFTGALLDADASVRQGAVRLVAGCPRAATLLPVAIAARDGEPTVRWAAVEAVAAFPEEVAAWLLRDILRHDPDAFVRAAAARAAARFPSCAEFLGDLAVAEPSATARAAIVEAAAEAGGAGAAALLKRMARDGEAQVRAAVAAGMGRTPSIADLRVLREYAGDADDMVRVAAAAALGEVQGREAADALWACASDASDAVRGTALAALVRRGEKDAVTAWLRQDPRSAQLRTEVAVALDQGGDASQALEILAGTQGLSHEGLALAGWCAVELKLWDAARLYLQRATLAGEPHATAWDWAVIARALDAAHEGRPEAEGLLRAAVESAGDPAFAAGNAAYLLADSLLLPSLALEFAQRAAAVPDASPDVIDTLGWVQFRAGLPAEAERTLLSLRSPPGPEGWLHRAAVQAANDHAAEAAASLREALLARPALAPRVRTNPLLAPLLQRPELETWK